MIVELLGREAGLTFECMHIVPGKGDCSRIHPHFHYIDVSVDGEFDDKRRVVHLYNLKAIINRLCLTFEDKILLADYPETIQKIVDKETHYHIEINNKYYLIPKSDIFRINIPSLNIEDIAVYCIDQLIINIKNDNAFSSLNYIEVVLSEGHGQRGKIKKNLK